MKIAAGRELPGNETECIKMFPGAQPPMEEMCRRGTKK
jgi:hypothetical protein